LKMKRYFWDFESVIFFIIHFNLLIIEQFSHNFFGIADCAKIEVLWDESIRRRKIDLFRFCRYCWILVQIKDFLTERFNRILDFVIVFFFLAIVLESW